MTLHVTVELVNIGKRYNCKTLFQGINAVIGPGQCLGITGPNGSGKSTLLNLIAGIGEPSEGHICIKEKQGEIKSRETMGYMGMVSPQILVYDAMTGSENIMFFSYCSPSNCDVKQIQEVCRKVGLDGCSHQLVSTYSTGMKQRLKLAIVLVRQPALWLLDEPSSNLDAPGKALVEESMTNALKGGATVIVATNEGWERRHASEQIILT